MIYQSLEELPHSHYNLIYADPPWKQSKGGKKAVRKNSSGTALDYPTCSLDEIKAHLKAVTDISAGGGTILFLWTIDKYLFEAQQIAESLGYKLHARMIWDKVTGIPAAFTVRFGHEYLLYMYKDKLIPVEQATKHSKKPQIAYEIIERLYPSLNKLEMYARNTRDGWDSWGNELTNNQTS